MAYAVGIDLGTTNSVIAIRRRGVVETLTVDGRHTTPSVVSFREDGSVLVGHPAKSRLLIDPETTIASAKRFMGDRAKHYRVGRRDMTPVDIASMVLRKLVEGARVALKEDIWDAVITVPAYFNDSQREDTKRAGEEAGLNVLRLIPEPTAAAIAYGLDKSKDQTILVYDLGGGTFDVSILTVRGNKFDVKAVGGDGRLGGDDFDETIVTWVANRFKSDTGLDVLGNKSKEARIARQRLKEAAEAAKLELSQSSHTVISIPNCMGHPIEMELSLEQYNKLITPLLDRTIPCIKSVLRDARLQREDIDRVILVGGSTKNRAVRELLAREIKDPFTSERVDEVVAHGGAVLAASLFLPEEESNPIQVSDVTAHSLGIDMLDDNGKDVVYRPIIPRQTSYPCRRGFLGGTSRPMQSSVALSIYRGEERDPRLNTFLGHLEMAVLPPQEDSVPIGAIFELDVNGIIHFTAVQLPLTSRLEAIVRHASQNDGDLAVEEVDKLIESGEAKSKRIEIKTA